MKEFRKFLMLVLVLTVVLLTGCNIIETGQKIEMQYSSEEFPLGLSVSEGFALHLFETPGVDQGYKKYPPETGAKRYYDDFTFAGQTFLVITEESNPAKFYLDANQNGDMTDDKGPFLGERQGVVPNHYTLEIPYKKEKVTVPYRFWIFPSGMGGTRFYPKCCWRGKLMLSKNYELVLFDGNSDGDYSNDPLVIDINNDGKTDESEQLTLGKSCTIDGKEVKLVSIAQSGRYVRWK